MDDQDKAVWRWTLGAIAAALVGLPAIGFVAYWVVALLKVGWELAARI
jgi:hypothetical protein